MFVNCKNNYQPFGETYMTYNNKISANNQSNL